MESIGLLSHRGPDSSGAISIRLDGTIEKNVDACSEYRFGLGHTRLAILDLTDNGRQPFRDNKGNWLIFNGEIYNYLEIRSELKKHGHCFHTSTDTEVILAAYQEYGYSCVKYFNGMWAFALYDSLNNKLFLSRDRLGIKPLYYIHETGIFAFASEIKPLLHLAKKKSVVLLEQLAISLIYGPADKLEQTIYQDIKQFSAGHIAILDLSDHSIHYERFWDLPQDEDFTLSDDEALDIYSDILEDSIRIRLRADVPVALTLSGGIDSSVIALAASRLKSEHIPAYTSHFPDIPNIDETQYALQVGKVCNLDVHLVEPDLSRLVDDEKFLCKHQELPFGSLSLYVHWAIVETIKQHGVKVILNGQGGDELFLGYERYFVAKVISSIPNFKTVFKDFIECAEKSTLGIRKMALLQIYFTFGWIQKLHRLNRLSKVFRCDLLSGTKPSKRSISSNLRDLQKNEIIGNQLSRLLRYDDRTTSAHGIESRLPFLDYRMVEFAYKLPWKFKIREGWSKWISRLYLSRNGLDSIAWRKKKLGFNAPTNEWAIILWKRRFAELSSNDVAKQLMNNTLSLTSPSNLSLWDIFNVLELAMELEWDKLV